MSGDPTEKRPIVAEKQSPEAAAARKTLQAVLDRNIARN
jgi:hypothetical protein